MQILFWNDVYFFCSFPPFFLFLIPFPPQCTIETIAEVPLTGSSRVELHKYSGLQNTVCPYSTISRIDNWRIPKHAGLVWAVGWRKAVYLCELLLIIARIFEHNHLSERRIIAVLR